MREFSVSDYDKHERYIIYAADGEWMNERTATSHAEALEKHTGASYDCVYVVVDPRGVPKVFRTSRPEPQPHVRVTQVPFNGSRLPS